MSMARFVQNFVVLLCIAIFSPQISSEILTSVTLHTSIYFRDYVESAANTIANSPSVSSSVSPPKRWPVLKAIESIRFYGGDIAGKHSSIVSMTATLS